jgi:hypothetical protein
MSKEQYDKYRRAAEQNPNDKVDSVLFKLDISLSGMCDKYGRVKYKDIADELMAVRVVLKTEKVK